MLDLENLGIESEHVVKTDYDLDMAHPPRVVAPGETYHLMPRGNDGRDVFLTNEDRSAFLSRLDAISRKHGWMVYGYCLMDTHVHLLVQVPEGGLSEGMQGLLSGYARWWNKRHGHFGHVFLNRFRSKHVESDRQLLATARYIDLNPVKAGMRVRPEQWLWSSYRAHAGIEHPLRLLANSEFLKLVGPTPDGAKKTYARFVAEGRTAVSDTGLDA